MIILVESSIWKGAGPIVSTKPVFTSQSFLQRGTKPWLLTSAKRRTATDFGIQSFLRAMGRSSHTLTFISGWKPARASSRSTSKAKPGDAATREPLRDKDEVKIMNYEV